MATYVPANVKSGLDFNTLSDAEKFLVGQLFSPIYMYPNKSTYSYYVPNSIPAAIKWSFTSIRTMVFTGDAKSSVSSNTAFNIGFESGSANVQYLVTTQTANQYYQFTATLNNVYTVRSAIFRWTIGSNVVDGHAILSSFTTIDGKVHTAANLNY